MAKTTITAERLRELLDYDETTGIFIWRVRRAGTARRGAAAGTVKKEGHLKIKIDGREHSAARLAWLYVYGQLPTKRLSHKNTLRDDIRIANLCETARTGELTAERLREVLDYDPTSGAFRLKVSSTRRDRIGTVVGSRSSSGHRLIKIDGRKYGAHRLAWFYVHGTWPDHEIDHKNNTPDDNRFTNLREATDGQNRQNSKLNKNNTSGFRGVYLRGRRWQARITAQGDYISLGAFDTPEAAYATYCTAAGLYHGAFAGIADRERSVFPTLQAVREHFLECLGRR